MATKSIASIRSAAGYVTVTLYVDEDGDARLLADDVRLVTEDEGVFDPISGYFEPGELLRLAHAVIDHYEGGGQVTLEIPQDRVEAFVDEVDVWNSTHSRQVEELAAYGGASLMIDDVRDVVDELKAHQNILATIERVVASRRESSLKVTLIRHALAGEVVDL